MKILPSFRRLMLLTPLGLSCLVGPSAQADLVTWGNFSGTTSFTDNAAWTGGVAPSVSGTAAFNIAATASPNLAVSSTISSLQFSAAAASGYVFSNSNSAILNLSSLGTTTTTAAIASLNTSGSNVIGTSLNLLGAGGSTQVFTQAAGGTLVINGTIGSSNAIRLQLANTGNYVFNAANTFSGTLNQNNTNTLTVGNKDALGTSVYNPTSSNSRIQANTALTGANKITNNILLGSNFGFANGGFALELGGNIDLGNAARTILSGATTVASAPILSGVISNDGGNGLTIQRLSGNNFISISGTSNTYTGLTTNSGAFINVAKFGVAGSASSLGTSGTIRIGVDGGSQTAGLIYTGAGETTNKTLDLRGSGPVSIDTTGATGALVFSSSVTLSGTTKTLALGGNTTGNSIDGNIVQTSGTLSLLKEGTGTWRLGGNNSYLGSTTINAGTLLVTGTISSTASVSVQAPATLTVNGLISSAGAVSVVGTLTGSGTIAGATSITGALAPGNSAGLLSFSSGLSLGIASTTTMEIDGTSRGVVGGYDAINVGGILNYGGNLILTMTGLIADGTYDLFSFTTGTDTGGFGSISFAGGAYSGSWAESGGPGTGIWTASSSGQDFTFTESTGDLLVVPEPSTVLLFGLAGSVLLIFRRRNRVVS